MDENTNKDLRRILSLYREYELRDNAQATRDTIWVPTPLTILLGEMELIDSWYSKERKSHEGKALIPGASDGRRGA